MKKEHKAAYNQGRKFGRSDSPFSKELAKLCKRYTKHEKLAVKLTLKDKKLSKSPAGKKYLKFMEKEVNKIVAANKEAMIEIAMSLYPLHILHPDGKIGIVKDYYKKGKMVWRL